MASKFLLVDRDQSFLQPTSFMDVLGEDHLVWTVLDVVSQLDLAPAYARYRGDPELGGRPAFDPAMMVALLFYAYCEGKRSSREIEQACRRDWAYRAICGNLEPDHATIARFRVLLDDLLASLFAQVLGICGRLGLIRVGVVAVDGTKMEAAASKGANRTLEGLRALEGEAQAMLAEAAAADQADHQVPGGISPERRTLHRSERLERIKAAKEKVEADLARLENHPKHRASGENASATRGRRLPGPEPSGTQPSGKAQPGAGPQGNVTDPDSRLMKTQEGFVQGYNAQAVATEDQVVLAAEISQNPGDVALLEPMLQAAEANLDSVGVPDPIGVGLADAGYWSEDNGNLTLGMELLIATTKGHRVGKVAEEPPPLSDPSPTLEERAAARSPVIARAARGEISCREAADLLGLSYSHTCYLVAAYRLQGETALTLTCQPNGGGRSKPPPSTATLARRAMEAKLAEEANRDLYRQRGWMIEGVFAHTKTHRGCVRFQRRGLAACDAEWKLMNLVGNLLKIHRRSTNPLPPIPDPSFWSPSYTQPPRRTRHCRRHRHRHARRWL